MKLKLSRITLVVSIITMISLSIFIFINDKEKIKIEELQGSKSELEDVNIIFQNTQNLYKTTKTTISKEGISEDKFSVTTPNRFSDEQDLITNQDMLSYSQGMKGMYQYDNYVGVVNVSIDYSKENFNNKKEELVATVMEENIDTKEVKNYKINLGTYFTNDEDNGISTTTVSIKHKGELYIVVGVDIQNYDNLSKESRIEESRIYVYKLNLDNESSEHILTKTLSKGGESRISNNISFSNGNKAYFVNSLYEYNDNNEIKEEYQLLSFDLETRKFYTLELEKNIDEDYIWIIHNYYLKDDKLYIIYNYEIGKKINLYEMEIDLKSNEILNKKIVYSLDFEDNKNINEIGYSIDNIRCIDNKLFISIETQKYTESSWSTRGEISRYLYVVDRNSKKTLYAVKGSIEGSQNSVYDGYINLSVVK